MATGTPCPCGMGMLGSCPRCSPVLGRRPFTGPYRVPTAAKKGWECPKCGMVMAPWMPNCTNCKPADQKGDSA